MKKRKLSTVAEREQLQQQQPQQQRQLNMLSTVVERQQLLRRQHVPPTPPSPSFRVPVGAAAGSWQVQQLQQWQRVADAGWQQRIDAAEQAVSATVGVGHIAETTETVEAQERGKAAEQADSSTVGVDKIAEATAKVDAQEEAAEQADSATEVVDGIAETTEKVDAQEEATGQADSVTGSVRGTAGTTEKVEAPQCSGSASSSSSWVRMQQAQWLEHLRGQQEGRQRPKPPWRPF